MKSTDVVSAIDEPRALAQSLIENLNSQEDMVFIQSLIQQQKTLKETRSQILTQAQTTLLRTNPFYACS